jgi:polar amino acid transport system substrate-binding protein
MTTRRMRATRALCGAVLLSLIGACAGPAAKTTAPAPSFAPAQPVGVNNPAVIPSAAAGSQTNCDVRHASLRPGAGNAATGPTLSAIKGRGRLVVGVDQNTYLFGYRDPASGQIVGFDVDILREVAFDLFGDRNAIQFTAISSAQRIPAILSNQVDLVAETMTINCDRLQQVDFSSVYFEAGQRVLVPKDSTATGIADLGGKNVCAADGSTSIRNIANAASKPVAVSVPDWTDCLVLLQQGQVAAISTDDTILQGLAAQDPNLKLVGDKFTDEPYGIAVSKNANDLLRFVNRTLERIRSDGTWAAIYTKQLKAAAPNPPPAGYRD